MFDPQDIAQVQKLRNGIWRSYNHLSQFRDKRYELVKQFIGAHYSDEGIQHRIMVNTLAMSHDVIVRNLITKTPRSLVNTRNPSKKAKAARFEAAHNKRLILLKVEEPLTEATSGAMFCMGIVRTGLGQGNYTIEQDGTQIDPGEVFVKSVDFDDFVVDCRARKMSDACFIGNWFQMPLEQALDGGMYDEESVRASIIDGGNRTDYDGDKGERVEDLSGKSDYAYDDQYMPYVRMLDVYLPYDKTIITLPLRGNKVAATVTLQDGEPEPYTTIGFTKVANNLIPKAPLSDLMDLHISLNAIALKTAQKCERQKTVTGVRGTASDDANRVLNANDGDMIKLDNPDDVKEFNYGGPDGPTAAMMLTFRDWYSWSSWNLDALGGLGVQADTATQERIINQNSSEKIRDMQDTVIAFVRNVVRKIGWYDWHDPFLEVPIERQIGSVSLESIWTPEERQDEYEYDIDIHPYSLREESPSSKLESITMFFERFVAPYMPIMAQQGITFDFEAFVNLYAKYSDNLDVKDLVGLATGQMMESSMSMGGEGGGMPANTTRTNVRVNKPGGTRQGKDQMLANLMFGGNSQGSEKAAIGRAG